MHHDGGVDSSGKQDFTHGGTDADYECKDTVFEADGGFDEAGTRQQDGRELHQKYHEDMWRAEGCKPTYDNLTGQRLDPELVHAAKELEMEYFKSHEVYTRVAAEEVQKTKGALINMGWVVTNKGDTRNLDIRARLVGKEYKTGNGDTLYAATPPLEALRVRVSKAASVDSSGERPGILINDVTRAYFCAKTIARDLFVRLPPEDKEALPGQVGRLNLCLYGTRDAAANWQDTLSVHLQSAGFVRGIGHPSVFHHPARRIHLLVHGDDYVSVGPTSALLLLEQFMLEK